MGDGNSSASQKHPEPLLHECDSIGVFEIGNDMRVWWVAPSRQGDCWKQNDQDFQGWSKGNWHDLYRSRNYILMISGWGQGRQSWI